MQKSGPLFNLCPVCRHQIPEGDMFCDALCQAEYVSYLCVSCGEFVDEGETIADCGAHPEWEGKRICKECWKAI